MPKRDDVFKSEELGKALPKMQKVIIIGTLVAAILVFVYSFIFMTPFSDIYQIDGPFTYQSMAQLGITKEILEGFGFGPEAKYFNPLTGKEVGLNLAYFTSFTRKEFQVFNHWLFTFGFFGLIASLLPFIYFSQKRKIYYKTNLIAVPAVATFNLYIGIHMLVQLIQNHLLVLSKTNEFILLNAYETHLEDGTATEIIPHYHTHDSDSMFIIGYIIVAVVIFFAITCFLLTYSKYRYQKNQKQVDLSKVVIHE